MGTLPTISLACIMKNERKNLPRFFESIRGCMDEIIMCDTGSTDDSVSWCKLHAAEIAECPVHVHHFEWVNDFSKARNFSLSKATMDYVYWQDLDDVLSNREAFIEWKKHSMPFADAWLNSYNYALDAQGVPIISFVRERAFRRSLNPQFQYPIHEGVVVNPAWQLNYITTWAVNHMRDMEDIIQDKSRNIKILEELKDQDSRLMFYYGKELYENQRPFEALPALEKVVKRPDIQPHDKVLSYQYAAYSAVACANQLRSEMQAEKNAYYRRAIDACIEGIKNDPHRAELFVCIGDCYVQLNQLRESIPYFATAKACINTKTTNNKYEGAIYSFVNCYGELPSLQLAKIYYHLGDMDKAIKEATECFDLYKNEEAKGIIAESIRVKDLISIDNNQIDRDDIVFSCPPHNAMEFDEEIYKIKGTGGSETALIQMAKELKAKTGREVIVFNMRKEDLIAESGVRYVSNTKINEYLSKYRPKVHIAWRHNIKITKAKTYLWMHDLYYPGVESVHSFDVGMCLSPFHKNYVHSLQGVPKEKLMLTRNGIDPKKFAFEPKAKDPNKIVWMSSADRGLDSCMLVMDEVVKEFPSARLHIYYGIDNLYSYGLKMSTLADKLKKMIQDRPYVDYHGFVEQSQMYQEVSDAVIWLHPCNWPETYCITAIECLANKIFPITRRLAGLQDTLKETSEKNHAVLLDHESNDDFHAFTGRDIKMYYNEVCKALLNRSWERIDFDLEKHSWSSVADEWIEEMDL